MPAPSKNYATFDCDAHVSEVPDIWAYLSRRERERVAPHYRADGDWLVVNDSIRVPGTWAYGRAGDTDGWHSDGRRVPNRTACIGPAMDKVLARKLFSMRLSDEQCDQVDRAAAYEPRARLRDMDAQGIDQVMLIPLHLLASFLLVRNGEAAALIARAYNDWVRDWCSEEPERLYAAAVLPLIDPAASVRELERVAMLDFRVAMVRPVEIGGHYPAEPVFDPLWEAFAASGLVAGVHTLGSGDTPWGGLLERSVDRAQMPGPAPSRCLGFVHEAMIWVGVVLMTGLLERHARLKMAIMESNASWLPHVLEVCDAVAEQGRRESPLQEKPSVTFLRSGFVSFEADEDPVFEQHEWFREIAIWASDLPHIDGADAWTAIERMSSRGVPPETRAALMGGNARRMYGIEPRVFTQVPPASVQYPDWFPAPDELEREYAPLRRVDRFRR